jgi:hypothetical protein
MCGSGQSTARLAAAAMALTALLVAGCTTSATAPEPPATTFTSSTTDPSVVRQIMADSAWLQKNRLPAHPAVANAPKPEPTCPVDKVHDRGRHQLVLPADLMTTMVLHDAKPWAYLRYDVDGDGTPLNVTVETSSGLKSFDRAAIETVTSWRFDLSGGLKDAHGCVSEVALT